MTGGGSLIPTRAIAVLSTLPGLLINIVFGGIMIGKRLPSVRRIWHDAAPHAILGGVFFFGQFAIGGHGTIAGMGGLLETREPASWSTSGWAWPRSAC